VHSAEDEDYGKPHRPFSSRRRRAGRAAPSLSGVGDAPAGVLAAKASSMTCIAVPSRVKPPSAFGLADLVVDSLLEVTDASLDALETALSA